MKTIIRICFVLFITGCGSAAQITMDLLRGVCSVVQDVRMSGRARTITLDGGVRVTPYDGGVEVRQ